MTDHEPTPLTEFRAWPKTPRYSGVQCRITEKIDGTNACVVVCPTDAEKAPAAHNLTTVWALDGGVFEIFAQSRTRFITPESDNFGFARWVRDHAAELVMLGPGRHYGEWYGAGIQRRYGLDHKRFALFREYPQGVPACCEVVPTLYAGPYSDALVRITHERLMQYGSRAVPGWDKPEGIVMALTNHATVQKITDAMPGAKHTPASEPTIVEGMQHVTN